MSDNPPPLEDASALRRRKVLANSQKRMERLQRLKRAEVDNKVTENSENLPDVFGVKNNEEIKPTDRNNGEDVTPLQSSTNSNDEVLSSSRQENLQETSPEVDVFTGTDDNISSSISSQKIDAEENGDGCQDEAVTTSMPPKSSLGSSKDFVTKSPIADILRQAMKEEGAENTEEVENEPTEEYSSPLSWFFRKRRLFIFMLLAVVSYCIAHKGLDVYISAMLGSAWKKGGIGKDSFAKLYGAVELQMLVAALISGDVDNVGGSTPALLRLTLNMSGVPKPLLSLAGKLSSCVQMVVTDFCVYLFTYVMLGQVGF